MPGKKVREKSFPLKKEQSRIATNILLKYYDKNLGEKQFIKNASVYIDEINAEFIAKKHEPIYNITKLLDWTSNRLYRYKKKERLNENNTCHKEFLKKTIKKDKCNKSKNRHLIYDKYGIENIYTNLYYVLPVLSYDDEDLKPIDLNLLYLLPPIDSK